jgi:tRNA pseudouridine38-40 synthase
MRVGLVIEYEGTALHGSQLQANARTVQGELEAALHAIFGEMKRVHLASRTDAGVHAMGQVAAFDADERLDPETIRKALNHYLPEDIRTRCAQRAPDAFDPRRQATYREYVYTMNDAPSAPAVFRRTEVHVRHRLDEAAMDDASRALVGSHDFAAFAGPATPDSASTVRRVESAVVRRKGDRLIFTLRGNAFLHQQVRRTAAALVAVGRGAMDRDGFESLVATGDRGAASKVLAPHGLCLNKIGYDDEGSCGLPQTPVQAESL